MMDVSADLRIAIGVATAVFAIVNGVVIRPLPFQHATHLGLAQKQEIHVFRLGAD
jgi:hypothetical protein